MNEEHIELTVHTDYLVDRDARRLTTSTIRFPKRRLTLSELIRNKLSQEIHAFNERKIPSYGAEYLPADEYGQVEDEGTSMLGSTLKKGKANPATEVRLALRALSERKFKVLFNDHELLDPSDVIVLDEHSRIVFVRLIPIDR